MDGHVRSDDETFLSRAGESLLMQAAAKRVIDWAA